MIVKNRIKFVREENGTFVHITTNDEATRDLIYKNMRNTMINFKNGVFYFRKTTLDRPTVTLMSEVVAAPNVNWIIDNEFSPYFLKELRTHTITEIKNGNYNYKADPVIAYYRPLWEHQKQAASFIQATGFRCILRDSPRLGKCFSVLEPAIKNDLKIRILCPPELCGVWESEIGYFIKFGVKDIDYQIASFDKKTIEPDFFEGSKEELLNTLLIVDESHKLSKRSSQRFKRILTLSKLFEKIVLISGNDPQDDPLGFFSEVKILFGSSNLENYKKRYLSCCFPNGKIPVYESFKNNSWLRDMGFFYLRRTEDDIGQELIKSLDYNFDISLQAQKRVNNKIKNSLPITLQSMAAIQKYLALEKTIFVNKIIQDDKLYEKGSVAVFSNSKETLESILEKNKNAFMLSSVGDLEALKVLEDNDEFPAMVLINSRTLKEGFYLPKVKNLFVVDSGPKNARVNQMIKRASKIGVAPPTAHFIHLNFEPDKIFRRLPAIISLERMLVIVQRAFKEYFSPKNKIAGRSVS